MNKQTSVAGSDSDGMHKDSDVVANLRYWLANEDIYTSPYVRNWLERTPRKEAADVLAEIARTAQPEPHSLFHMVYHGIMMLIRTSDAVSDKNPSGRKAGTRAAMLLASLNDARCIAPLVRVFETNAFWQGRYQEAVESSLLRFLSGAAGQQELRPYADDLRNLAECLWQSARGRGDLSSRRADLLLVTLQRLAELGGVQETALLKTIAGTSSRTVNRSRIRDACAALLNTDP